MLYLLALSWSIVWSFVELMSLKNFYWALLIINHYNCHFDRYSATTILSLLQEVSQFASVKIDWKALVQKSSTGISSAREYQMLWRHLAYRDSLLEKVEDGAEPLVGFITIICDTKFVDIILELSPKINHWHFIQISILLSDLCLRQQLRLWFITEYEDSLCC